MPQEFFDVVDDQDKVVGRRPGSECVRQGHLHRAIAVLLFDERGRLYIQRRADWMGWYPGHWTLSVMGHVSSGETYEQAAKREVAEELGIGCRLTSVAKVRTPDWRYNVLVERKYLTVFEGRVTRPKIELSEESQEGRFIGLEEFVEMAKRQPEKFTPILCLPFRPTLALQAGGAGSVSPDAVSGSMGKACFRPLRTMRWRSSQGHSRLHPEPPSFQSTCRERFCAVSPPPSCGPPACS